MGQLIVRNIENAVKARLQRRAKSNGRSMEEEVRDILRDAANEGEVSMPGLGTEISTLFSKVGLACEIAELRRRQVKPASFDE